jgi:hypothetical protein
MTTLFFELIIIITLLAVLVVCFAIATSFVVAFFGGGPFVPTPKKAVREVLKHAKIRKGDRLYDIGAGDGRYLHFAEKDHGAIATGFEIDPFVYALARFKQITLGWKGKMVRSDFRKHSLKDADIVICYMLPSTLRKYQSKFDAELQKGCKVISYSFKVGNWKPIKTIPAKTKTGIKKIYIYSIRDKSAKKPIKTKTNSKTT